MIKASYGPKRFLKESQTFQKGQVRKVQGFELHNSLVRAMVLVAQVHYVVLNIGQVECRRARLEVGARLFDPFRPSTLRETAVAGVFYGVTVGEWLR